MVKGNLHFRAEDVEIVRALMKAGASARMQTGNTKESPIHYVAGAYIYTQESERQSDIDIPVHVCM